MAKLPAAKYIWMPWIVSALALLVCQRLSKEQQISILAHGFQTTTNK